MDNDLAMIFGFILLVLMITLPFAFIVARRAHEHEERKLELTARLEEAKASQRAARSDEQRAIENRLRVLERIVTDRSPNPSADLAREIEGLRRETAQ